MSMPPMNEEVRAEVRSLAESIAAQPIEWRPELVELMGCAFALLHEMDRKDNPMSVCEDFAAASALFSYAAAIDWISTGATRELIAFGRYTRDQTLKKWAGKMAVVQRGGGMPDSTAATKH